MTAMALPLVLVVGCSWWTGSGGGVSQEPDEFPILWERAGTHCTFTRPMYIVARNQAQMAYCPVSDVPVDFSREMVLIAILGRVTSDQYAIRIDRVWREGSVVKVDVRVYRPPPSTQSAIRLACPYHVVVVPRSNLNIEGFAPEPSRLKPGASPLFSPL